VDFSLLLPGVALLAAGTWAARMSVYGEPRAVRPGFARALLIAFAAVQLPAGVWTAGQALADRAAAELNAEVGSPRVALAAAERVGRWAPWRSEGALAEAWSAEAEDAPDSAVSVARKVAADFPTDADAQRRLALILHRGGACTDALAAAARARELQPANWRNAVTDARISRQCHETDRMIDAWARALTCEAPQRTLAEAYASFPYAIVWVDRLAGYPERLRRLAMAADRDGDPASAAIAWDLASQFPGYENQVEQVEILIDAGRLADARAVFERVRHAHPDHPRLPAIAARLAEGGDEEVPDLPGSAVARRIRAVEAESGPVAAQAELERQALLGHSLDPTLQYERARLMLILGDPRACTATLGAAGLVTHPALGPQATALLRRCEQALP
jgi:tetratricopeptide (TPR) repeat protein